MINFRKPTLEDRELVISRYNAGSTDGTCYSFGSMFAWGDIYSVEIAEYGGLLLERGADEYGKYYVYPSGVGDKKAAIEAMMKEAESDGEVFRFCQLLEENKREIQEMFPDLFDFWYDRDSSEYVYSVKNMIDLPGKRFHGKKGHVNAFFRNHTDISCDPITDDNIHLCMDIENQWLAEHEDVSGELEHEHTAIQRALSEFKKLGFSGAILYADGKPVAFTMGEPLKNNTFCTHYEKTIPEYRDAYPVINNGFTRLMLSSYDYVNREEDTGAEGLRKAKLSYHPEFLLDKYSAVLKNDPMRKYSVSEEDVDSLKSLWETVFGDERDTIDVFFKSCVNLRDVFAYKADGKVVSAFYLLDADIVDGSEQHAAKYLYAAATLPEYRRKGYMGEMIEYAKYILTVSGCEYLFLYPAKEALYDYYEKFGFIRAFRARYYDLKKSNIESYAGGRYFHTSLSYPDMTEFTPAEKYARFSESYLDFAAYCAKKYGFEREVVFDDEVKLLLTGNMVEQGQTLMIEEALLSGGSYSHVLSVLADADVENIRLKVPPEVDIPPFASEIKDAGMLLPLNGNDEKSEFYLGQPCM